MSEKDALRARAEATFKPSDIRAAGSDWPKAEPDAAIAARDANTDRLKRLRLAREASERDAVAVNKSRRKVGKPITR